MQLFWADLHACLHEDAESLSLHLAVRVVSVGFPRLTLERAPDATWEILLFANWHRPLSAFSLS